MADVEAKTWVRDLAPGRLVDSTFAVLRKDLRRARTGAPFLSLELGDRTGRVRAVSFDDVALLDGRFAQGDTVRVLGAVEEYRGRVQVIVRSVERVEPGDPLRLRPRRAPRHRGPGGLPRVPDRRDARLARCARWSRAVYADARFRPLMRHAPVTIDAHHAYAGGAIQHTVAVATHLPRGLPAAPAARRIGGGGGGAHVLRRRRRRVPARRGAAARRRGPAARHPAAVAATGRAGGAPAADAARAAAAARALRSRAAGRGRPRRPRSRRRSRSTPAWSRRCRRRAPGTGSTRPLDCARAPPRPAPARPDGRRGRGERRPDRGGLRRGGARRGRPGADAGARDLRLPARGPAVPARPSSPPAAARWSGSPPASRCRCWSARRTWRSTASTTPRSSSPAARCAPATTSSTCRTTASSTRSGRSRRAAAGSCSRSATRAAPSRSARTCGCPTARPAAPPSAARR